MNKNLLFFFFSFLFIIVSLFAVFSIVHFLWIEPNTQDYDKLCKCDYGKNYIYESGSSFGKYCIELIYENLTKANAKPFDWNNKDIMDKYDFPKANEIFNWKKEIICEVEDEQ